jgi:putative intracellular protease/amidase
LGWETRSVILAPELEPETEVDMAFYGRILLGLVALFLTAAPAAPAAQKGEMKGKILVVLSSENQITLKDGVTHATGFFLPELMGPASHLVAAGYSLVFANPKGNPAVMDKVSDNDSWYGNGPGASAAAKRKANREYLKHRELCASFGVCGKPGELAGPSPLRKLSDIRREGLDSYQAVLFPGGHAPMEDLWKDEDVGQVLRHFHDAKKITALICHAPIALLSALANPSAFISALITDDRAKMVEASKDWIYRDYAMTVFTTREEQQEEPGQDNMLGGYVAFYPDAALEKSGAFLKRADKWKSHAVQDRELITGQNPGSHDEFAKLLVKALARKVP